MTAMSRKRTLDLRRLLRLGEAETLLRRSDHPPEAGIIAKAIQIWIGAGMPNARRAVYGFEPRFEGSECLLGVATAGEGAGNIIPHVQIIGVEQQRPLNPFLGPFPFTDNG